MHISGPSSYFPTAPFGASANNEAEATKQNTVVSTQQSYEDKVTISAEGRKASATASPMSLESLRVHSWATDFSAESTLFFTNSMDRVIEESRRFNHFSERFGSDGHLSDDERQAMINYRRNNMPLNTQFNEYEQFDLKHKNEFEEFGAITAAHRKEAFAEFGIFNYEEFQEKVLNVEGDNQALRKTIQEKILNDPRAVELMGILHIKDPA